ncbi:Major Facilitator Superfamily protein [Thermomonospora echinospora]|uniref:Major Facilitator Superfamily protein n=1 Tax=Thermomonospora echinospora TaxID=1992 RepID=A0A1H6BYV0_9ACTN|nr:MFS transporter [Thermomonospora echinospora]SEG65889.1 Major Facilitator Superfamily protein [Thermomonospora echinospora]
MATTAPAVSQRSGRPGGGRVMPQLLALAAAGMVVSVQQTLVIPLLPRMMTVFDVSVTAVTWVFTVSLLAGAVTTPLLARFGDMYGKKPMILVAIGLQVIGSVVCALSGSLGALIAGRALQGVSAAMIPLAIALIRDTFPRERVTTAIGVVSATMGVGGALGMIVTGLLAARTDSHHPVFWINAGLATAVLLLVMACARDVGGRAGGRPDVPGTLLLAGWLVCLLLAISQGNSWGWGSPGVLGLFTGAAVLCAVWTLVERRVRVPLVDVRLLVGGQSLSANAAALLLGFAMFTGFTLTAQFMQVPESTGYGMGGSVLDVGLLSLPSTVTMLAASLWTGRLALRIGAAFTLAAGALVTGLSFAWLAVFNDGPADMIVYGGIQGVGLGVAYAALGTLAVQHVPMDKSGIASGINSLVRVAGGSIGGAASASVVAAYTRPGAIAPELGGYVLCFVIAAVGAGLAAVVAVVHGLRHRPPGGVHVVEALETS